jgi:DnaK suppressor protein
MANDEDIDIAYFKNVLLERQAALRDVEQQGRDAAQTVELDQSRVGRLSRMDALQGQAMSQATLRRREVELQKIAGALKRVDDDEYGYCLRCGEAIGVGRLQVDPAAPFCVKCADSAR